MLRLMLPVKTLISLQYGYNAMYLNPLIYFWTAPYTILCTLLL